MSTSRASPPEPAAPSKSTEIPLTLWLGAAVIVTAEVLLFVDVARRGVAVLPPPAPDMITVPTGGLAHLAHWVAVNMTPICWVGFLLLMDGLLAWRGRRGGPGSPVRRRPRRFAVCVVTSVGTCQRNGSKLVKPSA